MSSSVPVAERPTEPPQHPEKLVRRHNEGTGRLAALLLSPTMIVLGLVVLFPIISALRESLYTAGGVDPATGFVREGSTFSGLVMELELRHEMRGGAHRATEPHQSLNDLS